MGKSGSLSGYSSGGYRKILDWLSNCSGSKRLLSNCNRWLGLAIAAGNKNLRWLSIVT